MKRKIFGLIITVVMMMFPVLASAEETPLAQIGEKTYLTLEEAVADVEFDTTVPTTIEILRNAENTPGFMVEDSEPKNIIIDFNGYTIQLGKPLFGSEGTVSQNIHIEKGSTFVFKNGTLKAAAESSMLIQNYANLTIEDMTLDATTSAVKDAYALSLNNGVVVITGNTNIYSNYYAFDAYWWPKMGYTDGTQVTVDTTGTIKGIIDVSAASDKETSKTTLLIKNVNFDGKLNIEEGLEKNVTVEGGSFNEVYENATLEEGAKYYEVLGSETTKYVIAIEDELKEEIITNVVTEENVVESEKKLVEEAVNTKYKVASYYDIDLGKYTPSKDLVGYVTTTEEEVTVTLDIPTELKAVEEGYTRNYVIIRIHDGKTDVLTTTNNGDGTISFKTGKFSTYALAYEDVKKVTTENPATFDIYDFSMLSFLVKLLLIVSMSLNLSTSITEFLISSIYIFLIG